MSSESATTQETATLLKPEEVPDALRAQAAVRTGFREQYPYESRWFQVDGHIQHYVDEGRGPVLLMVHGNPTWSFAWRRLVSDLRSDYRVLAVDHLGCGFSAKPQNRDLYTLEGHIRRLTALVEALDLREVTLFGHDWGGAIGMGCAGRLQKRFRRFVLMNTAAFHSSAIPLRIAVCRIPVLGQLGVRGLNLFSKAAIHMAVERPLEESATAGFLAPYDSWHNRVAVQEFVEDIPVRPSHRSYETLTGVEDSLRSFRKHPVLLIWGMRDWCFTPAFYREFRQRFPESQSLELADAGHYVFEDAHERMLPRIREFLAAD